MFGPRFQEWRHDFRLQIVKKVKFHQKQKRRKYLPLFVSMSTAIIGVIELIGCFPGEMKFDGLGGTPYALFNP